MFTSHDFNKIIYKEKLKEAAISINGVILALAVTLICFQNYCWRKNFLNGCNK